MKIIFLGGFFPKEYTQSILNNSKNQVQNSANKFQWAFINGLNKHLSNPLRLITAPFIGWFPKYFRSIYLSKRDFKSGIMVGFLNLPLLKNLFKFFNLAAAIRNEVKGQERAVIIIYSLNTVYLRAAIEAKRKNPNLRICVIVPDLLEFPGDAFFIYRFYVKHYEKPAFYRLMKQIDGFIVLTDEMVNYLKIKDKPWIRIEGLFDSDKVTLKDQTLLKEDNIKIILYTGTLDYQYGIIDLMDAFHLIKNNNYHLWICGGGIGSALVIERAKNDERINFMGIVDADRVSSLQKQATILINPRNSVGEFNKYSFPSKTMEYLASGTPALIYRLAGIPSEYFQYCYTIDGNGIYALRDTIIEVCEKDRVELITKGVNAREFITTQKNSFIQTAKVVKLLETL